MILSETYWNDAKFPPASLASYHDVNIKFIGHGNYPCIRLFDSDNAGNATSSSGQISILDRLSVDASDCEEWPRFIPP